MFKHKDSCEWGEICQTVSLANTNIFQHIDRIKIPTPNSLVKYVLSVGKKKKTFSSTYREKDN